MAALVIAHRTCPRDVSENTLAGIRVAAAAGADAVEIDVRLTADGEPVLMHDPSLWRMTRKARRLDATSLADLRRLRVRGSGETVPTLAEALAALGPEQRIAIDVKDPAAADAVVSEARNQGVEQRALFWAKNADAVAHAVSLASVMEPALLRDAKRDEQLRRFLADAGQCGARGISAHWSVVSPAFVASARSLGIKVYAWCKTSRIDVSKVALLDGVVTDWPATARGLIDAS